MENIFDSRFEVFSQSEFEVITAAIKQATDDTSYIDVHTILTRLCSRGQFDIPTSHFSERFLFRTVFIPKGLYSERFLFRCVHIPLFSKRPIFRRVISPKGLYSERGFIRKFFSPTGFYSDRFLFRKVISPTAFIPKGLFSEIRNINRSE